MGFYEAKEDNIPMEKHKGFEWYYPPCYICGEPVATWNYIRGQKYSCKACKEILANRMLDMKNISDKDKKDKKLREAIRRISKMADINKYDHAIKLVEESLYKKGWFQSTEEIMAALELTRCGYKFYHQTKIGAYKVDFIIPELKVALEIDGTIYHGKDRKEHETIRDKAITAKLGENWNVVRINTENINKNITKLVPAIKAVLAYRKRKSDPYPIIGKLGYKK